MTTVANPTEALLELVEDNANKANEIATAAKSALGNSAKMVKDFRENSETEDEKIRAFQKSYAAAMAKIEQATVQINDYIRTTYLKTEAWDEETEKAKRAEHKGYVSAAREAYKAVAKMHELLGLEAPTMPEILTFSGSTAKAGGSTGIRRLRFDRVEVNGEAVKNLSAVATKIKGKTGEAVTAGDLQKVVFETAKTEDMDEIAALGDVSFNWSSTDKDGVSHEFEIVVYKAPESEGTPEDDEDEDENSEDATE